MFNEYNDKPESLQNIEQDIESSVSELKKLQEWQKDIEGTKKLIKRVRSFAGLNARWDSRTIRVLEQAREAAERSERECKDKIREAETRMERKLTNLTRALERRRKHLTAMREAYEGLSDRGKQKIGSEIEKEISKQETEIQKAENTGDGIRKIINWCQQAISSFFAKDKVISNIMLILNTFKNHGFNIVKGISQVAIKIAPWLLLG